MTLGDRELLELNELCGAVVDGTLTEPQLAEIAALEGVRQAKALKF